MTQRQEARLIVAEIQQRGYALWARRVGKHRHVRAILGAVLGVVAGLVWARI